MSEERFALIALIALASWIFMALPLIYLSGISPKDLLGPIVTALSALIAASIALAALSIAREQLSVHRQNQRETTAKTNFREFLKLCIEYPDFAYGKSIEGNRAAYEWFVAQFLWAAEEILEFAPKEWEPNLKLHIAYHREYLQNDSQFREYDLPVYTPRLQNFIDDAIAKFPATYRPGPPPSATGMPGAGRS